MIELHPLQTASVKLLTALYADKHLPTTPAIVAIANYYYPSIEQILATLDHYKTVDLVIRFNAENEEIISDAKNRLVLGLDKGPDLDQENSKVADTASEETLKDIMSRPIKSITIDQLEEAFAKALLELTGQDYEVDVNRFDLNPDPNAWATDTALLDLKLSSKRKNPFGW